MTERMVSLAGDFEQGSTARDQAVAAIETVALDSVAIEQQRRPRRQALRYVGWAVTLACIVVLLAVLFTPNLLVQFSPTATGNDILKAPGATHWFGTDQLGRDVFSRVVYGARPVLAASFGGVALATVIGIVLGIIGGAGPRAVRAVVMRVVDVLLSLPVLMIALILIATVGPGLKSIAIAVGIAFAPGFARVIESSVRKLRSAEYVQAARVFGSTGVRTSLRHLLPNLATEVVVLVSSGIGWAVLTSTTLSFLGLGVKLPSADWGSDLAAGATYLATAWWLSTFPGAAITVTILVANFAGDSLTEALDPRGDRQLRHSLRTFAGFGRRNLARTVTHATTDAVHDPAGSASDGEATA
jgi:peptide/nickel transport system permease protein